MKPDIVLMTDFGLATGYVGSMYGVIRKIDQSLGIFDLNHEIKVFDIRQASSLLADTVMYWKDGTVFVSVVDPGVGTSRRSCVVLLDNGSYVVTPDNGTLTKLLDRVVKVREIDEKVNRLKGSERANSFHGRDVYAFTAARLAGGVIDYAGVGAEYPLSEIVRFETTVGFVSEGYAKGRITGCLRHFGSPETDISVSDFEKTGIKYGDFVNVTISRRGEVLFKERILFHKSFGYVPEGEPILCNGSTSPYMEISLNKRSFAEERLPHIFDAGEDFTDYEIEISKA